TLNLPRLSPIETWSNSKLSFMVLQPPDKLTAQDLNFLDFLYQKVPQIKATAELTKNFKNLFSAKAEGSLQDWLTQALETTSELQGFAKGSFSKDTLQAQCCFKKDLYRIWLPKPNFNSRPQQSTSGIV